LAGKLDPKLGIRGNIFNGTQWVMT
jgi:hypothetical protein